MEWEEWPLTLFTVTAQTAMGAFGWCFVALTAGGLAPDRRQRLERLMIVVWALVALAFAMSAFHLGSPWRAINATFRFGQSAMSNEVVFGSAFAVAGLLHWLLCWRGLGPARLRNVVLWATLALGIAFLASMTAFYLMPTVPTWNSPLTPLAYVITAAIGGSAVAAWLFAAAGIRDHRLLGSGPITLAALAAVCAVLVAIAQGSGLADIASSIRHAGDATPDYAALMGLRFVVLFAALGLWLRSASRGNTLTLRSGITCALLVVFAEMVGRAVFYSLYMTVGLR